MIEYNDREKHKLYLYMVIDSTFITYVCRGNPWRCNDSKNTWPKREKLRLITSVEMLEHNSTQSFFAAPLNGCGLYSGELPAIVPEEELRAKGITPTSPA